MPAATNDINVRRHLIGLLRREESVDDFIDWFQPAYWQIDKYASDEDYDLAMSIDSLLWQLSGGWISDEEFFAELRDNAVEFGVEWQPVVELPAAPRLAW